MKHYGQSETYPKIEVLKLHHRNTINIGLKFSYNNKLIAIARKLPYARWSNSKKLWYIPYSKISYNSIIVAYKDIATLNFNIEAEINKTNKERQFTYGQKQLLNGFYKYLKGKRYSDSTIKTYVYLIADFVQFYDKKPVTKLNNRDVEVFIETVFVKQNYSISTQRQFISALKLFILFKPSTQIENLKLQRPKRDKHLPSVLSQREAINLIGSAKNLKHRAIIALLYSGGLRVSELINLKIEDLCIERRQVHIKNSKGRKDRYITLAESFLPLLKNYFMTYKPKYYFVEGQTEMQKYTASSIRKFIKKYKAICGIKINVTPHTLRHSYATHLLENGVNLRHIQELLGHSKPETTMIYTKVARKDLLSIKSPLDFAIEKLKQIDKQEQKFHISGK